MDNDSFTKVTSQSWFSRIGSAFAGLVIGVVLFVLAFPLLTWNEGRAINRAKTLQIGSRDVISVPSDAVNPVNEGKLVHVSGDTSADEMITDSDFGVSTPTIRLRRKVEMYQWKEESKSETKTKLGGGDETVTTYTYSKNWSPDLIDSARFEKRDGHDNPEKMAVDEKTISAEPVRLGAFVLPQDLTSMLKDFQPHSVKESDESEITVEFLDPVHFDNGGFYIGEDPNKAQIGDTRVRFEVVKPGAISVIARQIGETFEPYVVKDDSINLLTTGTVSAENMFKSEMQGNVVLTWIYRVVGFFMMFFGLTLVARPLSVLASVLPFLGSLVGAGAALMALAVSLPLTVGTIAIAWLAYRPLIGVPLFLLAVACIWFGIRVLNSRKKLAAPPIAPAA